MAQTPRAVIKFEFGKGLRLGPGKIRLLELVAETGSIAAAAREMKMSYRRAWLLIEELNKIFDQPVLQTAAGGSGGGGAKITQHGKKVIALFRELQIEADALVATKFAKF
jgi:molybdate transport system regulatory protein